MKNNKWILFSWMIFFILTAVSSQGEQAPEKKAFKYNEDMYKAMQWRCIGPFRGGRATAVAGITGEPYTYYFGSCGGGVWKTEDGGINWHNISDGFFKTGSVGAIAVSEWDSNVVYVGMGEVPIRGNVSHGDGMYKSTDAGKTWKHIGLSNTSQISRIRIHPRNPDLVYVAALGHVYGPNKERGVFKSKDGGKTWQKVLFQSDKAGAIDLILAPNNPRIIFAAFWEAGRTPYSLKSGGQGSGIFKSSDSGESWEEISRNKGLPKGVLGKIGITVSPAKHGRVWAIIEAEEGGVFRSDDEGESWVKVNEERKLRQRAWYYSRIYADPKNSETVYVLNTGLYRSVDGGKTYSSIRVPHGDNHDLWIAPDNPDRMINSNDGGANVTYNGGLSWTEQDNQPTAQFYHVATDEQFPYWVYGAQQDNSTIRIASRTSGNGIDRTYWHAVGGGESGYIAPRNDNSDIVYAGSYGGLITRWDYKTRQSRIITPWPENPMGWSAGKLKYRFQWTFPIMVSRFDSDVLYCAAQVLFKSFNEGQSWTAISRDLTTNDKSKQKKSGGPITFDDTSVEYYCTIFSLAESVFDPNILWVGTDDGLVHITRNAGNSWQDITPKQMPKWSLISRIDTSTFGVGRAYIAVDRHELDDFSPYIYKTDNFGMTWKKITKGLPKNTFVRVVREDPERKGLLYAGTETGVFVSFDNGENWQSLQLNLPVVPVHDMVVKEDDLVIATHGRSFWILDDLSPLQQLTQKAAHSDIYLFRPSAAYRMRGRSYQGNNLGKNPPAGSGIYYYLKNKVDEEVTLEFSDMKGNHIKTFSADTLSPEKGMNRFSWNMRYPDAVQVQGAVLWGGSIRGPIAVPGQYQAKLTVGEKSMTRTWEWRKDPRIKTSQFDFSRQFDLLIKIRNKITEINKSIIKLRYIKDQIRDLLKKVRVEEKTKEIISTGKTLLKKMTEIENVLIQSKSKSRQDPLNYPILLDNKMAALARVVASADARPTDQSYQVFKELSSKASAQMGLLSLIIKRDLAEFNKLVRKEEIPAISLNLDILKEK